MPNYMAMAREALEKYRTEEMSGHSHLKNGVDKAEGPHVEMFKQETALVKAAMLMAESMAKMAESISRIEQRVAGPLEPVEPVPLPLFEEPTGPVAEAAAPAPVEEHVGEKWLKWQPKPKGTPLESLGWKPDSAEYLAFTTRLPFPVNTVEEIGRVREADLLAAEWVGETVTAHIKDRLENRKAATLLPDDWQPPEGPPSTMANPAMVYIVKRDTVIPQPERIKSPYAGRTMTPEEIAKERGLALPEVQALLLEAEPHWNTHPHYLYHWALQRGYALPKHKLMDRGKKKAATATA